MGRDTKGETVRVWHRLCPGNPPFQNAQIMYVIPSAVCLARLKSSSWPSHNILSLRSHCALIKVNNVFPVLLKPETGELTNFFLFLKSYAQNIFEFCHWNLLHLPPSFLSLLLPAFTVFFFCRVNSSPLTGPPPSPIVLFYCAFRTDYM